MPSVRDVLLLRDDDGVPYVLPRQVVAEQELVSIRARGKTYLLTRQDLLGTIVPEAHVAAVSGVLEGGTLAQQVSLDQSQELAAVAGGAPGEATEALAMRGDDGTCFLIGKELLERSEIATDGELAAAEELMLAGSSEVTAHGQGLGSTCSVGVTPTGDPLDFTISRMDEADYYSGSRGVSLVYVS